jgi:hypothetical protein
MHITSVKFARMHHQCQVYFFGYWILYIAIPSRPDELCISLSIIAERCGNCLAVILIFNICNRVHSNYNYRLFHRLQKHYYFQAFLRSVE